MNNFHISLPCKNLEATKRFYHLSLGLPIGRESSRWLDVDVYGNQITFAQTSDTLIATNYYALDKKRLPLFHIGIVLNHADWKSELAKHRLKNYLAIEPTVYLQNQIGEHDSFFLKDPNGYYLEFKTFRDSSEKFKKNIKSISD